MAKALKTVGKIAGLVATVAVIVGNPVVAAIASAVSFAATLAGNALTKPPPTRGSIVNVVSDPNAPQPYAMGEGYFAGILRYDTAYGPTIDKVPNPYRFMVIVYSGGGPIDSIAPRVDFAGVSSWYNGYLFTTTQLGACPEAAHLTGNWGGIPNWGANYKLSGQAAIAWNFLFDKDGKRFASGLPLLGAYGKWVKVYDPRKDDTQPGGVGAHRLGDETTYEWSENPALHAGTYAYGRYQNGTRTMGIGLPADGIDWPNVAAWANVCDANGWTMFGVLYEPGDRWANLKDICFAGGADPIPGGKLSFKYAAPVVALDTITMDDIILTEEMSAVTMHPYRDRLNTVIPKYRSAAHNWEMVDAESVENATFLADDGEVKREVWPFNFVKDVTQAAQLAAYRLFDTREIAPITLVCGPRLRNYRAGECLHLDIPELGLDTDAVILSRTIDPQTMSVTLELTGETPSKHAYCLGQTGVAPPTPALGQTGQERDELAAAADSDGVPQIVGPASTVVEAQTNGTPVTGELPKAISFRTLVNGVDRTADATWAVGTTTGTITVTNTDNVFTLSALDTLVGSFIVSATVDGVPNEVLHEVAKRIAGADINTGTGGTSSTDNSFNQFSSDVTHTVVSDVMNMQTGTGGGVELSAPLQVKVANGSPPGTYSATLQWQQDSGGGTWVDVGSAFTSTLCEAEPDGTVIPGSVSANVSLSLAASTAYSFRLRAIAVESDGVNRFLTGTASATGS